MTALDALVAALKQGLETGNEALLDNCECPISYWDGMTHEQCRKCKAWGKVIDALRRVDDEAGMREAEGKVVQAALWYATFNSDGSPTSNTFQVDNYLNLKQRVNELIAARKAREGKA